MSVNVDPNRLNPREAPPVKVPNIPNSSSGSTGWETASGSASGTTSSTGGRISGGTTKSLGRGVPPSRLYASANKNAMSSGVGGVAPSTTNSRPVSASWMVYSGIYWPKSSLPYCWTVPTLSSIAWKASIVTCDSVPPDWNAWLYALVNGFIGIARMPSTRFI